MLPRSIEIGAHTYKLKMATRKELGKEVMGDVDNERNIIRVIRHATRSRKIEIILHECLHAMLVGHEFPDDENLVNILGEALARFFANNPIFVTEALKMLSDQKKS
jgi:Zn-dependent peptidase ImmA (M78 family)